MAKFLIDANLPYRFSLWKSDDYIHQNDIDDEWTDSQIWDYAKDNNLTIITKDADFSNRIFFSSTAAESRSHPARQYENARGFLRR